MADAEPVETLADQIARIRRKLAAEKLEGQVSGDLAGNPQQRARQKASAAKINREVVDKETMKRLTAEAEPADTGTKLAASTPTFPEDRLRYYQRVAGEGGEVMSDNRGGAIIKRADGKTIHIPKSRLPDIAESVVGAVPSAAAAMSGVGLLGQVGLGGLGAGAANAARQAVGRDIATGDTSGVKGAAVGSAIGGAINPMLAIPGAVAGYMGAERKEPDRVSPTDRAIQAGTATALGAAGEAVPGLLLKGAGAARAAISPEYRVTRALEKEGLDAPSSVFPSRTMRDVGTEALGAQARANKAIGESAIALRPSQAVGSRELASVERAVAEAPGTMDKSAAFEALQKTGLGKFADSVIKKVEGDAGFLGTQGAAEALQSVTNKAGDAMMKARSAKVGPMYQAVDELGGGVPFVPAQPLLDALESLKAEAGGPAMEAAIGNEIKWLEGKIKDGMMLGSTAQAIRSRWGGVAGGAETISEKLKFGANARVGAVMLGAVDDALDAAANATRAPSGKFRAPRPEAVDMLRQANAAWKAESAAIEEFNDGLVRAVLKADPSDGAKIMQRVYNAPPNQLKNIMAVVDKNDPKLGKQIRGQYIRDMFEDAGHAKLTTFTEPTSRSGVNPAAMVKAIEKRDATAPVLFDGGTIGMLKDMRLLADRMKIGPGEKGSPTFPKMLMFVTKALTQKIPLGDEVVAALGKVVNNPDRMLDLLASPEMAPHFSRIFKAAAAPGPIKPAVRAALMGSVQAVTNYAGAAARPEIDWRPQVDE